MIIGLGYKKQVGKDIVCAKLIKSFPQIKIVRIAFGDVVKFELWSRLIKPCGAPITVFDDPIWKPTLRTLMQSYGDFMRQYIDPQYFIKQTFSKMVDPSAIYIFTDLRFFNELNALLDQGAILWHIDRDWEKTSASPEDKDTHISETELDMHLDKFHYRLENNGTKAELEQKAIELFQKIMGISV